MTEYKGAEYHREWRLNNPNKWKEYQRKYRKSDKGKAAHRRYYLKNREHEVSRTQRYTNKLIEDWRGSVKPCETREAKNLLGVKAEEIAMKIFSIKGYKNIFHLSTLGSRTFPFDIYAEKDGEKYAIEVTTYPFKNYGRTRREKMIRLLEFLDWSFIIIFISPDFSRFYMEEVKKIPVVQSLSRSKMKKAEKIAV